MLFVCRVLSQTRNRRPHNHPVLHRDPLACQHHYSNEVNVPDLGHHLDLEKVLRERLRVVIDNQ